MAQDKSGFKKGMVTHSEITTIVNKGKLRYLILLGQRSNGKSYAVKYKAVRDAVKDNEQFIYLRRYREDITDYLTEQYFEDCPITEITEGEYNIISIYRKAVYLANMDGDGNVTRGKIIGYVRALNNAERYKSGSYSNVKNIIFEEFISESYLSNEVDKLESFISTIFRQRDGCVFMVGNTITRVCPYFREFGLGANIRKQKQGTVDIYKKKTEDGEINIGVYRTGTIEGISGMFFRKSSGMINKGEWLTDEQPHLRGTLDDYEVIYTVVYKHNDNSFILRLLSGYPNALGLVWYVEPKTTPTKDGTRLISKDEEQGTLWTKSFSFALTKEEQQAFSILFNGYVCYADNLTGTEFKQCLKNDGRTI